MSQAPERMIRAQPHCAILPSSAARNRQGADLAARQPANPITLCDGHGSDFVTVAGQILMARPQSSRSGRPCHSLPVTPTGSSKNSRTSSTASAERQMTAEATGTLL
jgi:hypothetical protein